LDSDTPNCLKTRQLTLLEEAKTARKCSAEKFSTVKQILFLKKSQKRFESKRRHKSQTFFGATIAPVIHRPPAAERPPAVEE
jgi:hypothetical protein